MIGYIAQMSMPEASTPSAMAVLPFTTICGVVAGVAGNALTIDHIGFEVSDLQRTTRFYDAVFFALTAPLITNQPLSQTVLAGNTVTFNVTAVDETGATRDVTAGDYDSPPHNYEDGAIAFSPDSREVAFVSKRDGKDSEMWTTNHEVWVVPVSGGTARKVTANPAADMSPTYSPDGKSIVVRAQRRAGFEARPLALSVLLGIPYLLGMGIGVELVEGVGPVVEHPIASRADVDRLSITEPDERAARRQLSG